MSKSINDCTVKCHEMADCRLQHGVGFMVIPCILCSEAQTVDPGTSTNTRSELVMRTSRRLDIAVEPTILRSGFPVAPHDGSQHGTDVKILESVEAFLQLSDWVGFMLDLTFMLLEAARVVT